MDKSDIDNYAYFQEVWTSPKRYALVKNEFRDGYLRQLIEQMIDGGGQNGRTQFQLIWKIIQIISYD